MTLVNVYLARYERGWTEVGDLASEVANGRAEQLLSLGGIADDGVVNGLITKLVERTGDSYVSSIAGIEPAGSAQEPYVGFEPLDTVTMLRPDGTTGPVVVQTITAAADVNAHPIWTVDAPGRFLDEARDFQTWMRRALPGFAAGGAETANPARLASLIESSEVRAKQVTFEGAGPLADFDGNTTTKRQVRTPTHFMLAIATLTTAGSTNTVVQIRKSGTAFVTLTVPAGDNEVWVGFDPVLVNPTDTLDANLTSKGTGAKGLDVVLKGI